MVVVRNKTTYLSKITKRIQRMLGVEFWLLGDDLGNWGSIRIFSIGKGYENSGNVKEWNNV